jgi:hypothetical protein
MLKGQPIGMRLPARKVMISSQTTVGVKPNVNVYERGATSPNIFLKAFDALQWLDEGFRMPRAVVLRRDGTT